MLGKAPRHRRRRAAVDGGARRAGRAPHTPSRLPPPSPPPAAARDAAPPRPRPPAVMRATLRRHLIDDPSPEMRRLTEGLTTATEAGGGCRAGACAVRAGAGAAAGLDQRGGASVDGAAPRCRMHSRRCYRAVAAGGSRAARTQAAVRAHDPRAAHRRRRPFRQHDAVEDGRPDRAPRAEGGGARRRPAKGPGGGGEAARRGENVPAEVGRGRSRVANLTFY